MIEGIQPFADGVFDDFEIADHFILVERGGLEIEFDFPGVAVRKLRLVGVLGQQAPISMPMVLQIR